MVNNVSVKPYCILVKYWELANKVSSFVTAFAVDIHHTLHILYVLEEVRIMKEVSSLDKINIRYVANNRVEVNGDEAHD